MEKAVIYIIVIGVISGVTSGAGLLPDGPLDKSVGETVIFTTTWTPGKPFIIMTWRFGEKHMITSHQINMTDPEYEGRITLFPSTGSLELRNLTLNDSGEYEVSISPTDGAPVFGSTVLSVHGLTEKTPGGLSPGAIAAIVICTCLVVAAGIAGGYYGYKKKNNSRNTKQTTNNKNPQTQNTETEENVYENFSAIYENVK